MLTVLVPKLICPTCRNGQSHLSAHTFLGGEEGHIRDGILRCDGCGAWYPIENEVLEFVPADLAYPGSIASFRSRYSDELGALGCRDDAGHGAGAEVQAGSDERLRQRVHFDRYAEQSDPGFVDYPASPFWRAESARFLRLWRSALGKPGSWILDIGCGSGVHSIPLADQHVMIGFDISKKAVLKATEQARQGGLMANTTFFVGDATFLPFRDRSFDHAQTIGSLHHMPDPRQTVRDVFAVLAPGGIYFGVENNKSMFRGIFDLMMKIKPLWIEEAGSEPLISRAMLETWIAGLGASLTSETSVFLPPHLFDLLGQRLATRLLDASDRLCLIVPGIRNHGGQILFQIRKPA